MQIVKQLNLFLTDLRYVVIFLYIPICRWRERSGICTRSNSRSIVVLLDSFRLSQWFQATVENDPINKTNI